jgi:hypothetical protein
MVPSTDVRAAIDDGCDLDQHIAFVFPARLVSSSKRWPSAHLAIAPAAPSPLTAEGFAVQPGIPKVAAGS